MNRCSPSRILFCCLVLSLTSAEIVFAWGSEGHRTINLYGTRNLPLTMQRFRDIDYYFADHASDVDRRKVTVEEETFRQFIELERYPEYFNNTIPKTLFDLQKKYGESTVRQNGYLPYLVSMMYDSVLNTMKRRDWNATLRAVADLGHYVGDLTMPLNTTMNYDGQLTRNNGIKWRYEIELMTRYCRQLNFQRGENKKLDQPINDIFALLGKSFSAVPAILRADAAARRETRGKYNSTYYSRFWKESEAVTNSVMQDGVTLFSNLVYTAWLNAGGTKLVWPDEQSRISGPLVHEEPYEYLEPNFPNPFNPATTIKYVLTGDCYVVLSVFNLFGQEVAHVHDGRQGEGKYEYIFSGEHLPGGVYFVRLQVNNKTETRKMILSK